MLRAWLVAVAPSSVVSTLLTLARLRDKRGLWTFRTRATITPSLRLRIALSLLHHAPWLGFTMVDPIAGKVVDRSARGILDSFVLERELALSTLCLPTNRQA